MLAGQAEGVEDRETWERLRELGCEEAQGYFFAHPMFAELVLDYPQRLAALIDGPATEQRAAAFSTAR